MDQSARQNRAGGLDNKQRPLAYADSTPGSQLGSVEEVKRRPVARLVVPAMQMLDVIGRERAYLCIRHGERESNRSPLNPGRHSGFRFQAVVIRNGALADELVWSG